MPVLITVKEFQAKTRSRFFDRPEALDNVDFHLGEYHQNFRNSQLLHCVVDLELVEENLNAWAKGKRIIRRGGVTRYSHARDAHGIIYALQQQVERHLKVLRLTVQVRQKLVNVVTNPVRVAQRDRALNHFDRKQAALARKGYNDERELGPEVSSIRFGSMHSISDLFGAQKGFVDESDRASFVDGSETPAAQAAPDVLGPQAYTAVAYFLQLGFQADMTALDAEDELTNASNGELSTHRASLGGLYRALTSVGYQGLHYRQHCDIHSVINGLYGTSERYPALVVVGSDRPPFRLIVVKGYDMVTDLRNNIHRMFMATDGVDQMRGGREHGVLAGDGSFTHDCRRRQITETLYPNIGVIKFQR